MDQPHQLDFGSLLGFCASSKSGVSGESKIKPEDAEYLQEMVQMLRKGKRAVFIVETDDGCLKYMFASATRAQAVCMMGRVLEVTGRRIMEGH